MMELRGLDRVNSLHLHPNSEVPLRNIPLDPLYS